MKTLVLAFLFISFTAAAQKLKFPEPKHNFGYLQRGDIDTLNYKFTNESDQVLIFKEAKSDCNCVKVILPKDSIPGHGEGYVSVIFDTKRAPDHIDKFVTIFSNSKKGEEKLYFKGEILAKKKIGF